MYYLEGVCSALNHTWALSCAEKQRSKFISSSRWYSVYVFFLPQSCSVPSKEFVLAVLARHWYELLWNEKWKFQISRKSMCKSNKSLHCVYIVLPIFLKCGVLIYFLSFLLYFNCSCKRWDWKTWYSLYQYLCSSTLMCVEEVSVLPCPLSRGWVKDSQWMAAVWTKALIYCVCSRVGLCLNIGSLGFRKRPFSLKQCCAKSLDCAPSSKDLTCSSVKGKLLFPSSLCRGKSANLLHVEEWLETCAPDHGSG